MANWYDKFYNRSTQQYEPESNWWRTRSRESLQDELRQLWAQLRQRKPQSHAADDGVTPCDGCGTTIPNNHRVGCALGSSAPNGWIACTIEQAREDLGLPAPTDQ